MPQQPSEPKQSSKPSRRQFLAAATIGATAMLGLPTILTAQKSDSKSTILGEGDYKYEVTHHWPQLPKEYKWQTTHNVAVDKNNNLYVIHEGRKDQKDHPAIFVFDSDGKFIRAFGSQFQGGGHGIEVREEGGQEFLYICNYLSIKTFVKTDLKGEVVWEKRAPMESGVYPEGEDKSSEAKFGGKSFLPTNITFLDNGGFLLSDGYGSFFIHEFDKDAKWVAKFGGPGNGEGTFKTPHGLWIDRREKDAPKIVVCDRANNTLQLFDMKYKYLKTIKDLVLPANVDTYKDLLVVPELGARVTLYNTNFEPIARLGNDVDEAKKTKKLRSDSKKWKDGQFIHPHDACFDAEGNIFVAEWVSGGRVSKLKRLS